MKKSCVLLFIIMLACAPVFAGEQDFTLVNQTGLTINELYCSVNSTDDWEEDVLGEDVLEDEQELDISFSYDEDACMWDIMIVDEDGDQIYWREIDLCETVRVTLYYQDQTPTAFIEKVNDDEDEE